MWNPFKKKPKRKPTARRAVVQQAKQAKEADGMVYVSLHYANYVLPAAQALQLISLVSKAEIYEDKYHSQMTGEHADKYTHHVYENDKPMSMRLMPDAFYKMCKLAGKPEKK
jgi:hypothetical protein